MKLSFKIATVVIVSAWPVSCSTASDDVARTDSSSMETDSDTVLDTGEHENDSDSDTTDGGTDIIDTGESAPSLDGPCPAAVRLGGFEVTIYDSSSAVSGAVLNGVVPSNVPDLVAEDGDCVLLKRRNLVCDPPCASDQTCDEELSCIDAPLNQDVGTVVVSGLVEPVSMEAVTPGNSYFDTTLPHPVVEPGTPVVLTTDQGYIGETALDGIGVESLVLSDDQWLVTRDSGLVIHWEAPVMSALSSVFISFNIDQHGTSPSRIECTFEDDGEGEISNTLINQLLDLGVSGFPNGKAARRTVDSALVEQGCVDFAVASPRTATVRVAGLTPCDNDQDCPTLNCDETMGLCE